MHGASDKVVYLDLEYTSTKPHRIIQLGVVEADTKTLKITQQNMYYIKPSGNFHVDWYVRKLTGINDQQIIEKGISLKSALTNISKSGYKTSKRTTMVWGHNDGPVIEDECGREGIFNSFHLHDLSWIFRNAMGIFDLVSLKHACELLGIERNQAHDALSDALDTAKVHMELIRRFRGERKEVCLT